jgi:hypothetical protein
MNEPRRKFVFSMMMAASTVLASSLTACSSPKDQIVNLDLRQPTTPRQLNSRFASGYALNSPAGSVLKVTLQLPDATITGDFDSLNSNVVDPRDNADSPLNNVVLFDIDVKTLAEVKAIIAKFEQDFGTSAESNAARDEFFAQAATFVGADGRPRNAHAGLKNFAFGWSAPKRGTLDPGITIRPGEGVFSTYKSYSWDPLATAAAAPSTTP